MALLFVAALVGVGAAAIPSLANLSGSNFEGNDGNLVHTGTNKDWDNAPNRVSGTDITPAKDDNSFGQGTKEDDANVSVVNGSIPPNKSDLTRFYVANEQASNNNYLYLAWERSNVLGSANMDFEINKLAQPDLTTKGAKTLNRSAGDLLITFDFTNGGGNPVLGALKWLTTGSASNCFSSNSLPCWGANPTDDALDGVDDERIDLSDAGFAEGQVNSTTVTDPIANVSLPANTFGETAINLTASGLLQSGSCEGFSSAFLKSRSSASFPAEVKDFIAPQPVNINNCGDIKVKKTDDAGNPIGGVTFNLFKDNAPLGPPDGNGPNQDQHGAEDTQVSGKSCTTANATGSGPPPTVKGECTISGVTPGNYWVVEDPNSVPSDYSASAPDQYAQVTAGGTVNLTSTPFVNPRKHKVIVLVCHQGSNDLVKSDVSNTADKDNEGTVKSSIDDLPANFPATEAQVTGFPQVHSTSLEPGEALANPVGTRFEVPVPRGRGPSNCWVLAIPD